MTNKEYLDSLPDGEIVTNKKVLAAMKRKGLIYDYGRWGYLESVQVHYISLFDNKETYSYEEFISEKAASNSCIKPLSPEEYSIIPSIIEYMGYTFRAQYLSGCFQPYLQISKPECKTKTNPQMSVWGAIM